MRYDLENNDYQEDNLVQLYQDIMQCEEARAQSVYLFLIDVVIEIAPLQGESVQVLTEQQQRALVGLDESQGLGEVDMDKKITEQCNTLKMQHKEKRALNKQIKQREIP